MPKDQAIDYIEMGAADLDAVKAFYSAVFGWRFEDYGPDYTAYSDGRLDGGFRRVEGGTPAANGSALVVLYATDLEGTLARVRDHGGNILREIYEFPGGRRFHFGDPHGNELAVWSDPA